MDEHIIIEQYFDILIDKMKKHIENPQNQSFGSLEYHLKLVIKARNNKEYLNPLYLIPLPRWMGEYGNTQLEEEIIQIADKIDILIIDAMGGKDKVNEIRKEHNKNIGYKYEGIITRKLYY
jgi:hypothetical protein